MSFRQKQNTIGSLANITAPITCTNGQFKDCTSLTSVWDNGGFYAAGSGVGLVIPPTMGGIYDIQAYFLWGNATGGSRAIYVKKNSTFQPLNAGSVGWSAGDTTVQVANWRTTLNAGTALILVAYQSSGGDLDLADGYLSIEKKT